jgi:hypothetical protein
MGWPSTRRGAALVVLALVIAAVVVRLPSVTRPLGAGCEYMTSTVLRTQTIWYEEGALHDRFLPIMSYGLPADKYIPNDARIMSPDGDWYYTSYGSLSYAVPYVCDRAFGLAPSPVVLRLFDMAVQALSAVFVFLTVWRLVGPRGPTAAAPAVTAAVFIYLFSSEALWDHGFVYMADMFVQLPFAAGVYLVTRVAQTPRRRWGLWAVLLADVYLMVLSEWIGVLFAFAVAVVALVVRRRQSWPLAVLAPGAAAAGVATILGHYSRIAGLGALLDSLTTVGRMHAGGGAGSSLRLFAPHAWRLLARNYVLGFGANCAFVAGLLVVWLVVRRDHRRQVADQRDARADRHGAVAAPLDATRDHSTIVAALIVSVVPVVLHHLVLFEFTAAHSFATLKSDIALALIVGLLVAALPWWKEPAGAGGASGVVARSAGPRRLLALALLVVLAFAVAGYVRELRLTATPRWRDQGEQIARTAVADEVVFVTGGQTAIGPQLVYYAHRNIVYYTSPQQAADQMRTSGVPRGVVFQTDRKTGQIIAVRRITLDDPDPE